MRSAAGPWSLLQVAAAAGVTERVARTCTARGYLPRAGLRPRDIVRLRVAATLLNAPRPASVTPAAGAAVIERRNRRALDLVDQALDATPRQDTAMVVVTPADAVLASNPLLAAGLIAECGSDPVLVLPVGAWIAHLPPADPPGGGS